MSALLVMSSKKDTKPHKCKRPSKTVLEACEVGDITLLEAALKRKKDPGVNHPDLNGRYPLLVAAQKGLADLVGRLLRAGADVNVIETRTAFWNVLHYAAHSRSKELFFSLVQAPDLKGSYFGFFGAVFLFRVLGFGVSPVRFRELPSQHSPNTIHPFSTRVGTRDRARN
jgi:hypothetical protein